jgi:hypothetical protein
MKQGTSDIIELHVSVSCQTSGKSLVRSLGAKKLIVVVIYGYNISTLLVVYNLKANGRYMNQ